MIRPFPLVCFCAFAASGAWLYQVKHQVALKDRELVEIRRQTEQARQRMDILRAEWALLNEPDRLRQTATRVLSLEPMQPQHFARATDMDRRLPGAVAFAGAPDLFAAPPAPEPPRGAQPQVMLASAPVVAPAARAAAPASAPAATPAAPAAQPAAPQGVRVPEAPAPQALAAALAAQRAEQASRAAARPPAPTPQAAPQPPAPRPVQPAVHVTPGAPPAAPPTRVTRAPEPAPAPTFASALGSASALGRPTLAPPVPVGSASAATLPPPGGR